MSANQTAPIVWTGQHAFFVVGTDQSEDTLRIESNYTQAKAEHPLRLTLPTLVITYADMAFANAVGGKQVDYPSSREYGPRFFHPPVVLTDAQVIEKLTWIRGADRVVIGPETTEIEWPIGNTLVIPRLRLSEKEPATATVAAMGIPVSVDKELVIDVMQYGDGRNLGGIRIEKRHPSWVPSDEPEEYDLWVRVVEGETMEPLPEVLLKLLRWEPESDALETEGDYSLIEKTYADANGEVHSPRRPSGELEAVVLYHPGWRSVARSFRALPKQRVWFHLCAWQLEETFVPYVWKEYDSLENIVEFTGSTSNRILEINNLTSAEMLTAGMRMRLPCYSARYRMEPGDTIAWLADTYRYSSVGELVEVNGFSGPEQLEEAADVQLHGWNFFYAQRGDSLQDIDLKFNLPPGWTRTVGRVHHPDPKVPLESETVAVPNEDFVKSHRL